MNPVKKELHLIIAEVNELIENVETDLTAINYKKDQMGTEYYQRVAELRTQLLQGQSLKLELLSKLNNI